MELLCNRLKIFFHFQLKFGIILHYFNYKYWWLGMHKHTQIYKRANIDLKI